MYSQNTIPAAATGIILTAMAPSWTVALFIFCATFALIGAVCALKRTLPVPAFIKTARANKTALKLKNQSNSR